jgi:hypothetical protein
MSSALDTPLMSRYSESRQEARLTDESTSGGNYTEFGVKLEAGGGLKSVALSKGVGNGRLPDI